MLSATLRRTARTAQTARRHLNLHEYQSAQILAAHGVNVPKGIPARARADRKAALRPRPQEQRQAPGAGTDPPRPRRARRPRRERKCIGCAGSEKKAAGAKSPQATSVADAVAAASELAGDEVVIKSQILAGGRGLGTFTNGFQGGVHVIPKTETEAYRRRAERRSTFGLILAALDCGPRSTAGDASTNARDLERLAGTRRK